MTHGVIITRIICSTIREHARAILRSQWDVTRWHEEYNGILKCQPNSNALHTNKLRRRNRARKSQNSYFITDIYATDFTTMNTNQRPQGVIYVRSFKHYFLSFMWNFSSDTCVLPSYRQYEIHERGIETENRVGAIWKRSNWRQAKELAPF